MHALSLSLDGSIATEDGEARARQREYAAHFDRYTVVAKTGPGEGERLEDGPLEVIPTRSTNRYRFLLDAYRIGARICREAPPDVVTTQDPFAVGLVGWLLARRYGPRLHVQVHTDFLNNDAWLNESWEHRVYDRLGRFVLPRADAVRVGTEHERRKVERLVDDAPVHVAPVRTNVRDLVRETTAEERENVRERFGLDSRHLVLFVGRFVDQKRLDRWLDVAGLVRDRRENSPQFVLVGEGPQREHLRDHARELGLESSTVFPGIVSDRTLGVLYDLADVFLITSSHEGTSRVVVEAGLNELPVVATPFAGALDNVIDGETGFISDDDRRLAERIAWLLEHPAERERMGWAAREHLEERFHPGRLVMEYVDFLESDVISER